MNATNVVSSVSNESASRKFFRWMFSSLAMLFAWVLYVVYCDYKGDYDTIFVREVVMKIYFKGTLPNGRVVGYMHKYRQCGFEKPDEQGRTYHPITIDALRDPYFRVLWISDRVYGVYHDEPFMNGTTEVFRPVAREEAVVGEIVANEGKFIMDKSGGSTVSPARYCEIDVLGIWKASKIQFHNIYRYIFT